MSWLDDISNIRLAKEIAREARPRDSASSPKFDPDPVYVPKQYDDDGSGLLFLIFKSFASLIIMAASLTGFFVIANTISGIWAGIGTVVVSFFLMVRVLLSWLGYIRQD